MPENIMNSSPVHLAYDCFESDADPNLSPIILLHGFSSYRKTFRHVLAPIAEGTRRKVYAVDYRNYGGSGYTNDYHFTSLIDDVFHFMDTINAERVILVGHSVGCYIATHAAMRKPERIEMIVAEDATIGEMNDQLIIECVDYLKEMEQAVRKIPKYMKESYATKFVMNTMYNELSEENKSFTPLSILYLQSIPFKMCEDGNWDMAINVDVVCKAKEELTRMQVPAVGVYDGPAVFLCGTASPMKVRDHEEFIRKHFPKVEFVDFEGISHSIHTQLVEEFSDVVVRVCNRNHQKKKVNGHL